MSEQTMILEAPAPATPAAGEEPRRGPGRPRKVESEASVSARKPWIGCPVQFVLDDGTVIPGVLQRESVLEPGLYDVKVSPNGAGMWVTRVGVRYSEKQKPGCWSFGPA